MATAAILEFPVDRSLVLLRFDRVYGNVVAYPANDSARELCALTGKKTISRSDMFHGKKLGLMFEFVDHAGLFEDWQA